MMQQGFQRCKFLQHRVGKGVVVGNTIFDCSLKLAWPYTLEFCLQMLVFKALVHFSNGQ